MPVAMFYVVEDPDTRERCTFTGPELEALRTAKCRVDFDEFLRPIRFEPFVTPEKRVREMETAETANSVEKARTTSTATRPGEAQRQRYYSKYEVETNEGMYSSTVYPYAYDEQLVKAYDVARQQGTIPSSMGKSFDLLDSNYLVMGDGYIQYNQGGA